MRRLRPDVFIHCGDQIYADDPILPEVTLADGSVWKNVTTPAKSKVAETLDEFRGNFAYNLLYETVSRFNAEVAIYGEWDDHEVHNNWYPGQVLEDARYTVKDTNVLAARARRALLEYTPVRLDAGDPARVYRSLRRGRMLEVFMLDERSHRGPNSENRQPVASAETAFLGAAQLAWLKRALVELAELLSFIKRHAIKNVVVVTADVHYAAAHHYDPKRARFADFTPFWEFVAGPLHASTYGPNGLDPTFGPEVRYQTPPSRKHHRSPADGGQYFGILRIDGKTEAMTVSLHDLTGTKLYAVELPVQR
jgi:alkaline phosphatase D